MEKKKNIFKIKILKTVDKTKTMPSLKLNILAMLPTAFVKVH